MDQLVEMLSIGTLFANSVMAISIVVLRYRDDDLPETTEKTKYCHLSCICSHSFNMKNITAPTERSSWIVNKALIGMAVLMSIFCFLF